MPRVTFFLLMLMAFAVGGIAGGAAPPLDNCDTLCRMRNTFYNYNTGGIQRYRIKDCANCVAGRCSYLDPEPPAGNKCDEVEAPNKFDKYPGSPACLQGLASSLVEGIWNGDLIDTVDVETRTNCITVGGSE